MLLSKKTQTASSSDFPPVPQFIAKKKLVILPFENFSGQLEYDFILQMIPNEIYRFLQFANSYPFDIETALLKNEKEFFEHFGTKNPTAKQRKLYLETAKEMLSFKITEKEEEQFPNLPQFFNLEVIPPHQEITPKILEEKPLFLKGKITETNNIFLEIYDPVKDEIVLSWPVMVLNVNWDWTKTDTELSKTLALALLPFLEKISGKPFYPLHLEINPPQTTLYVNELFASQKILYLPQGEHTFKAVKPGFTHKRGQIDLFKPSKLSVTLQKEESKIPVLVQTTPAGAPVFIDETYYGLSPVKTQLPPQMHHIRVSHQSFLHNNTILNIHPLETKEQKIHITLEPEKDPHSAYKKNINFIKNLSFYSFFPVLGAFLYCQERYEFYAEKRELIYNQYANQAHLYNYDEVLKKENFFNLSRQFFRNSSIILLMTAAILQVLELEMDDIGVGVDGDKNLGIYWKF